MGRGLKTRSPLYLYKMSDKVLAVLEDAEQKTGEAKWIIVERILEKAFGLKFDENVNLEEFLGLTAHRAKVGKSRKKSLTK